MFVTNGNNKIAICPHCQHAIRQSDGYRYFLGKLICDPCYAPFVQNWRRKQSQLKCLNKEDENAKNQTV